MTVTHDDDDKGKFDDDESNNGKGHYLQGGGCGGGSHQFCDPFPYHALSLTAPSFVENEKCCPSSSLWIIPGP